MEYRIVDLNNEQDLSFIHQLYLNAFPEKERRDWQALVEMISTVPEMKVQLIHNRDEPVGFMISWIWGDWRFIEHFAISAQERGKKIGETVMRRILEDQKVLLEVEPPASEEAARRIKFYERLGMACLPIYYLQPAYRADAEPYEMLLMSNITHLADSAYHDIINLVFEKVYASPRRL